MSASQLLNWPEWADRTPEDHRESGSQFSVSFSRTQGELDREMDRLGAENYRLDHVSGSGGDPGIVLRWTMHGQDRVVACDGYTSKSANLREVYLWVKETRMSGDRRVETGRDQFAAAALPPGEDEAVQMGPPAHEVLNVNPNADPGVVKAAARHLAARHHPSDGKNPDREKYEQIQQAKEQMLG